MERLIDLALEADAAIQRQFDSCVFFLMRHFGFGKAIIRYALWSMFILTTVVSVYCDWIKNGYTLNQGVIGGALWIFPFLMIQRRDYRNDAAAEKHSMHSIGDLQHSRFLNLSKSVVFSIMLMGICITIAKWVTAEINTDAYLRHVEMIQDISRSFGNLVFLSMLYLVKTPPAPPKLEIRALTPACNEV